LAFSAVKDDENSKRDIAMTTDSTARWLKLAAIVVILVGIGFTLAAHPATEWPLLALADITFWPYDGAQSLAAPETRLAYGVGGGVMAGWGVMIWLLVDRVWPRDPQTVRLLILAGIVTWFVLDSAASFAAGAPWNVLVNVGFLAIFLLPLTLGGNSRAD
jgi:hypothetical protein